MGGRAAFTSIYARWTRQNLARRNGRYRFYLVRGWDSTSVADGDYRIQVAASDSRGNTRVEPFRVRVANG